MKENLTIFLISGKARHGKTTIANYIKELLKRKDVESVVTSYNKYIKMYARELTDWNGEEDTKPRKLLQTIGTELIREKLGKEDFFVRRLAEDMDIYNEYVSAVIIDDARLPLEIDYFKEKYPNNTMTIKVKRPNFETDLSKDELAHESEVGLDNYDEYDYTIENDGTLGELKDKVKSIIERIS